MIGYTPTEHDDPVTWAQAAIVGLDDDAHTTLVYDGTSYKLHLFDYRRINTWLEIDEAQAEQLLQAAYGNTTWDYASCPACPCD